MPNIYDEIREDLKYVAEMLEDNEFEYKVYNRGVQYNAKDINGITHSFWPTTGTIMLHRSNDKKDKARTVLKRKDIDCFMELLNNPTKIQQLVEGIQDEKEKVDVKKMGVFEIPF